LLLLLLLLLLLPELLLPVDLPFQSQRVSALVRVLRAPLPGSRAHLSLAPARSLPAYFAV
jgi:hypothetical protein